MKKVEDIKEIEDISPTAEGVLLIAAIFTIQTIFPKETESAIIEKLKAVLKETQKRIKGAAKKLN